MDKTSKTTTGPDVAAAGATGGAGAGADTPEPFATEDAGAGQPRRGWLRDRFLAQRAKARRYLAGPESLASHDAWLFLAPAVALHSLYFIEQSETGWRPFLAGLLPLLALSAPVVGFAMLRDVGRVSTAGIKGWTLRIAAFGLYPLLLLALSDSLLRSVFADHSHRLVGGVAVLLAAMEVALDIQRRLRDRPGTASLARRLSFERALLVALAIAAVGLSAVTVSDLERFRAGRSIRVGIDPVDVLHHFPTFANIALQLSIAYLVGYGFYWLNRYVLVRGLLGPRGPLHYLAAATLTLALGYPLAAQFLIWLPLHRSLQLLTPAENMNPFDPINGSVAVAILTLSLPLILALEWFRQNGRIVALEKERAETELDLLKQQIDPHFFFNTLNNLYALSRRGAEETPEMILRLSEMMRYVIYRGREASVPLEEEVGYLRDYVQLQSIRLAGDVEIDVEVDLHDPRGRIVPLLLIVPVENAFKHGLADSQGDAFLDLQVRSTEEIVTLYCRNSFEADKVAAEPAPVGIGLANLRRRLELLYPGRHRLDIVTEDGIFEFEMSFPVT